MMMTEDSISSVTLLLQVTVQLLWHSAYMSLIGACGTEASSRQSVPEAIKGLKFLCHTGWPATSQPDGWTLIITYSYFSCESKSKSETEWGLEHLWGLISICCFLVGNPVLLTTWQNSNYCVPCCKHNICQILWTPCNSKKEKRKKKLKSKTKVYSHTDHY